MAKINIAIDGPAGTGKSTTAKAVAKELGYIHLDSGAMYRAVTLRALQRNIPLAEGAEMDELLKDLNFTWDSEGLLHEGGEAMTAAIRSLEVNAQVSTVAALGSVREAMVAGQQKRAQSKGVVMDGRDIGTVVLTDAELKVFMVADLEARVQRRLKESEGLQAQEVRRNLEHRDQVDSSRSHSPLRQADDAINLDTSHLSIEQQVGKIVELARQKIVLI